MILYYRDVSTKLLEFQKLQWVVVSINIRILSTGY